MKEFNDWLAETQEQNRLTVEVTDIGNQFESKRYELQSADKSAPIVYLSLNEEGKISVFNTDIFHFSRFNIAEGFTEDNFREAALMFLTKNVTSKHSILQRDYVELKFGNLIAYGKAQRGRKKREG